ncbi:uncharacterized protein GIQ15_05263 [Arthroderma uncinatum]|uniref:uncharacterized protein n=1 Tax=Arthroderma uncinatum TaxID=74035 RepID=UPI00144AE668|nr:uncharacterized protein GIQ15_05263 [Arthroderma uncinatum]KAF3482504.1 hypothetical protein GIQ15_05263 [Arthroderma uncinatum]
MTKCRLRHLLILTASVLGCVWFFLGGELRAIADQYNVRDYLRDSFDPDKRPVKPSHAVAVGDKAIVMAALEEENTRWVKEYLPDWQRAIYTVNPSQKTLRDPNRLSTPANKGHEAMAYLTYVIEHYDALPSVVAFLHSHRAGFLKAWHVDAPLHDNAIAMQSLQTEYVRQNGYVNLRCMRNLGCASPGRHPLITPEVWGQLFNGTAQLIEGAGKGKDMPMPIPKLVMAACCAQFAVSREQIRLRPLEDYVHFRQWLFDTRLNDASSGRVFEYLWHIIFGKEAIYCPEEDVCYCKVYGRC